MFPLSMLSDFLKLLAFMNTHIVFFSRILVTLNKEYEMIYGTDFILDFRILLFVDSFSWQNTLNNANQWMIYILFDNERKIINLKILSNKANTKT